MSVTDRGYEDRFFTRLAGLARKAPLTEYQTAYNEQDANAVTVTENYEISAPAVERLLALDPPRGVDTRRNTVYLINWYGRSDFRFHVYSKTGEVDPETGADFGQRDSRKLVAWGGTTAADEETGLGSTRRVWFHDISAGPESWGGSWNVDDADLDGDDEPDYRIPPIWEYGSYRPAKALSGDLVKLVRYVALDLLFTTSPLYPVEMPTTEPPRSLDVDVNTYEGLPGVDASRQYIDPTLLTAELRELLTLNAVTTDNQDLPITADARRCYVLLFQDRSCFPESGLPPFANLFLQNQRDLARTKDDGSSVDYELPVFAYALDGPTPALGYADDNYVDGTQSFVFVFVSPEIVDIGYGLTTSIIHEVGHHVGLSHPHDGHDSQSGVDFEPTGDFFFAWAGDESNSMMSYIDLNWDFSQFDADNLDRFRTAALVEAANRLAAAALAGPQPARAQALLREADTAVGRAESQFAGHEYRPASGSAAAAYALTVRAARAAGVDVDRVIAAAASAARAARAAAATGPGVHAPGPFVDTLDHGPRGRR